MKYWTVEKLLGELAAILVRLENDKTDDAMEMAKQIVGYTSYHKIAQKEYQEELAYEAKINANLRIAANTLYQELRDSGKIDELKD